MTMPDPDRNRLIRRIHAQAREQGIDAGDRKALQLQTVGKASCADMTVPELRRVVAAIGGGPRGRRLDELPEGPHTAKLRALWISAWHLGVARNRSDRALAAWIRRQTGLGAARWATPVQTAQCIEALKDWLARDAGVDWSPYAEPDRKRRHVPRARVLEALWRKLHEALSRKLDEKGPAANPGPAALTAWVRSVRGSDTDYPFLDAGAQDALIRQLGNWLRSVS